MKFRIMMSVEVDARDDREAFEYAKKLDVLLKLPTARMLMESDGIRLSNGGRPVVHQPQRIP